VLLLVQVTFVFVDTLRVAGVKSQLEALVQLPVSYALADAVAVMPVPGK